VIIENQLITDQGLTQCWKGILMPTKDDYRLIVECEWADLHHSRIQEWTALGVVTGAHLGLIQLVKLAKEVSILVSTPTLVILATIIGALFSILGAIMTCRHRQLMKVKLGWIYEAEEHLGLIKTPGNEKEGIIPEDAKMKAPLEWKSLSFPRILSTSGIILWFYITLLIIDILALIAFSLQ
jgi:hypothetical protein